MRNDTSNPPGPAPAAIAGSPTPTRWTRPRWINLRVVVGLLLIIGSVVAGSRLLAADRENIDVWSLSTDLAAGSVLAESDVEAVTIRLGAVAAQYLIADGDPPVGQVVNRQLRAGELLPAAALGAPEEGRVVVLAVEPDRMPSGIVHGSSVDVYLQRSVGGGESSTERVLERVTVQDVSGEEGGLASVGGTVQVSVSLDPAQAQDLVMSLADGQVLLVLVTG